jgi:hypothetical protein
VKITADDPVKCNRHAGNREMLARRMLRSSGIQPGYCTSTPGQSRIAFGNLRARKETPLSR